MPRSAAPPPPRPRPVNASGGGKRSIIPWHHLRPGSAIQDALTMSLANAQEIGEAVLELGLVKPDDWAEVWPSIAEKDPEGVFNVLQSRALLTGLQVDKLRKGDTAGYVLGRFKLLYKISAGTFARVYRGVDL